VAVFLIIAGLLVVPVLWLLTAPLVLEIDTRVPEAQFRITGIGNCRISYQEEWMLRFRILFFRKTIRTAAIQRKKKGPAKKRTKKRMTFGKLFKKVISVLRSFRVEQWELAIDSDEIIQNARLYPLNFLPRFRNHLRINFTGDNYFYIRIRNRGWKILYAYWR
jgi:hypothetical protein